MANVLQQVMEVRSGSALQELLSCHGNIVLYFWCQASCSSHMDSLFAQLCINTPHARFFRGGEVVDKLEGANLAELANIAKPAGPPTLADAAAPSSLGMAGGPAAIEAVQQELRTHEPFQRKE
eukprot:c24589_g2_i1 orf=74-442(+)